MISANREIKRSRVWYESSRSQNGVGVRGGRIPYNRSQRQQKRKSEAAIADQLKPVLGTTKGVHSGLEAQMYDFIVHTDFQQKGDLLRSPRENLGGLED
jgi:hypothetical protein